MSIKPCFTGSFSSSTSRRFTKKYWQRSRKCYFNFIGKHSPLGLRGTRRLRVTSKPKKLWSSKRLYSNSVLGVAKAKWRALDRSTLLSIPRWSFRKWGKALVAILCIFLIIFAISPIGDGGLKRPETKKRKSWETFNQHTWDELQIANSAASRDLTSLITAKHVLWWNSKNWSFISPLSNI